MHISEGVLSAPVLIGNGALATIEVAAGVIKLDEKNMVETAVVSSALFVATLIHVPIGVSSVHLILNGLAGMLLGWRVFPAFAVAFFLQAVFFNGVGGFSTLGVNVVMMATPGFLVGMALRPVAQRGNGSSAFWAGAAAGSISIFLAGCILAVVLMTTGKHFRTTAVVVLLAHVPIMVVEGLVTGAAVSFLKRVRPETLGEATGPAPEPIAEQSP